MAIVEDLGQNRIHRKIVPAICQGARLAMKSREFEEKYNDGRPVDLCGHESEGDGKPVNPLEERKLQLLEELAAIEKEQNVS